MAAVRADRRFHVRDSRESLAEEPLTFTPVSAGCGMRSRSETGRRPASSRRAPASSTRSVRFGPKQPQLISLPPAKARTIRLKKTSSSSGRAHRGSAEPAARNQQHADQHLKPWQRMRQKFGRPHGHYFIIGNARRKELPRLHQLYISGINENAAQHDPQNHNCDLQDPTF